MTDREVLIKAIKDNEDRLAIIQEEIDSKEESLSYLYTQEADLVSVLQRLNNELIK